MSIRAIAWAFEQTTGSPVTKLVLVKLADNANDQGACWPSVDYICNHTELSRTTIKEHIKRLRDRGLLAIVPRSQDGVSLPNIYQLNLADQLHPTCFADGVGRQPTEGRSPADRGVGRQPTTNRKVKPSLKKKWEPFDDFPDEELQAEWVAFQTMRKQMGKPLTEISRGRDVSKLNSWGKDKAIGALRNSIEHGWAGLFEPKEQKKAEPIRYRDKKINELNQRKAQLLRMEQTPRVQRELEQIRIQLFDL